MKFDLVYEDLVDYDETRYSNDAYDYSWRKDHNYQYGSAVIVDGKDYSEIALFPGEAEVEIGDDIHVVYVSYNTGDSFGQAYGCREHLWAFSDKRAAYQLAERLEKDAADKPDYDFDNKPLTFKDVPISTNTWKGYFEHFNEADVVTVTVKRKPRN